MMITIKELKINVLWIIFDHAYNFHSKQNSYSDNVWLNGRFLTKILACSIFLTKYGLISLIGKFAYLDLFFQKLKQIFGKLFY